MVVDECDIYDDCEEAPHWMLYSYPGMTYAKIRQLRRKQARSEASATDVNKYAQLPKEAK